MKKKKLIICDREAAYARRFMEYVNELPDSSFLAVACTDYEELWEAEKEQGADILLYSALFPREGLKGSLYGQIILLTEADYMEEEEYPVLCKYQSASAILRKAMAIYAENASSGWGTFLREGKMKLLGIYSPVGRSGKTSLALDLGKELSKRKKTLYLNLEEYAGFEVLYPSGEGNALSDLLYFLKQGKKAFACRLEGTVRQLDGLDYIPPLRSLLELRSIEGRVWLELLEALERESSYEVVILDLSGAVNGLFELLERCEKVYSPFCPDENARAKWKEYEEELLREGFEDVLRKTKKVEDRYWEEIGKGFVRN